MVGNLKADDFEARIGKTKVPVLDATQQFSNRFLVLVETDGRSRDKVDDAVDMATRLARQAPAGKAIAFGAFVKRAIFTDGFIADEKERASAIGAILDQADTLGKRVALYSALHQALQMFGPHQPGDTVVLISDGYDDISNRSGREVEHEFLSQGVRLVFMFRQQPSHVTGNFNFKPPERDFAVLQDMSLKTGGTYTMFNAYFFSLALQSYQLTVRLPEDTSKPRRWDLRLRKGGSINPKRITLYFPEQLLPCSTAEERQKIATR